MRGIQVTDVPLETIIFIVMHTKNDMDTPFISFVKTTLDNEWRYAPI